MVRRRDHEVTIRLTQPEPDVLAVARQAPHPRGALCDLPSRADTVSLLAPAVCQLAGPGGLPCRAAYAAWEQEHGPRHLHSALGSWLSPSR